MKKKTLLFRGSVLITAVLSACGGGSGSSSTMVDPDTVLKGYVIDGPLVGANVCLDANSNWVCDAGEPSTTTTAKGSFALSIAPLKYQDVGGKQLIAEVGPDALDEASGMTLHAAGQGGYVLASRGGKAPVLSPIGTLQTLQSMSGYSPKLDTVNVSQLLDQSGLSKSAEHYFDDSSSLTSEERALAKKTGRLLGSLLSSAKTRLKSDAAAAYASDASRLGARTAELVVEALRSSQPVSASELESEAL